MRGRADQREAGAGSAHAPNQHPVLPPADYRAFVAFVEQYRTEFTRYAAKKLPDDGGYAAEDAVQDTVIRLYQHWDKVLASHNPAAYAYTVLKHAIVDAHRSMTRRMIEGTELTEDTTADVVVADPAQHVGDRDLLIRVLDELSPQQRMITVAFHRDKLPLAEIAARLQLSTRTVEDHLYKARRRLNEKYEPSRRKDW